MTTPKTIVLTSLQQSVIDAADPDTPLVVYRCDAQHGMGMSFLTRHLYKTLRWTVCTVVMPPRGIKLQLAAATKGVVFDLPYAAQFDMRATKKVFRTINQIKPNVPVVVMCHGIPPLELTEGWNKFDISNAPKAPY